MAAPLRIMLLCTKFGVGGIARHALELGAWLSARGHDVTYAGTPGAWRGPDVDDRFVVLNTQGVSGGDHGASLPARLAALAQSAAALRKHRAAHPVDLIHAHETAPALTAKLSTALGGPPIVLTFHGAEPARLREVAMIARLCADRVISVSEHGARELARLGGLKPDRISAIGLGVRPPPPFDPRRVADLRASLLGPSGATLVTTIARLSPQKGIDTLIAVSLRVRAQAPHVRFALVGDGPQEDALRAAAEAQGALEGLTFVGRSDEAHLYLHAADMFLLTSRWEALPFTIVEAFQAGRPAIATDCGGVRELIAPDVGVVTAVDDVEALSAAVLRMAGDADLRTRMGAAAAARAQDDRFKPDVMHARVEALYRDLVGR